MRHWHIITGEYPPQPGGVSDYTHLVARELTHSGDEVDVWAPECLGSQDDLETGIRVHRLPGHFGPRALAVLDRAIASGRHERILVQYVPHAFGLKAMNLPFCYWLYARRRWNIDVMFHEVAFARREIQSLRHNLLGEVTSLMAALVARSARRIFVASQAWESKLRGLSRNLKPIQWLPVSSNIPLIHDPKATAAAKARYAKAGPLVGHFGAHGGKIRSYLKTALPQLLDACQASVLLLGRGSSAFRDELAERHPAAASRLHGAGELPAEALSHHLGACDLMIQPYPDGISARRSSAMAVLAHGRAVVTTAGHLTEPLWIQCRAVATVPANDPAALAPLAASLLKVCRERQRLGLAAARLYRERFDVHHTIRALRTTHEDCDSNLDQA